MAPPTEADFGSYMGPRDSYSCVLSYVDHRIETDWAFVETLLQRIDLMWLRELEACCGAELFGVLRDATAEVDAVAGASVGAVAEAVVARARAKLEEVCSWATESVRLRLDARQGVSVEGGVDCMERHLAEHCAEVSRRVASLLDQLLEPDTDIADVHRLAQRSIENLQEEHESVELLKMANMEVLMELDGDITKLQRRAWVFAKAKLSMARVSAEPRQVVHVWLRMLEICRGFGRKGAVGIDWPSAFSGAAVDVVLAMARCLKDADVQRDGCEVLASLAALGTELKAEIEVAGGLSAVVEAMQRHPTESLHTRGAELISLLKTKAGAPPRLSLSPPVKLSDADVNLSPASTAAPDENLERCSPSCCSTPCKSPATGGDGFEITAKTPCSIPCKPPATGGPKSWRSPFCRSSPCRRDARQNLLSRLEHEPFL